jgi:hypothetical protein
MNIKKILLITLILNSIGCTTTRTVRTNSNDFKDKIFVFDSDLRRITLTFNDTICFVEQCLKIENRDTVKIQFNYTVSDTSLVMNTYKTSNIIELSIDTTTKLPPSTYYPVEHSKFSFWNNDDGTVPCLSNLKILSGKKISRDYLYCQKKVSSSYYNFFFMEVSKDELKKSSIKLEL